MESSSKYSLEDDAASITMYATSTLSTSTDGQSRGLRLLSLDGGGIRAVSELIILREMMNRIRYEEGKCKDVLPCDYFDLIGGTGTGGIIAILLGRFRMSVEEAIDCFSRLSKEVFSDRKGCLSREKFKATTLENAIKRIVKEKLMNEDELMRNEKLDGDHCKVFVCASAMNHALPHIIRTYKSPQRDGLNCKIWEAARATSAFPKIFKPTSISIDGRRNNFVDGAGQCNNPVKHVLAEAEVLFPHRHITCIVSIGAGCAELATVRSIYKPLQIIARNCKQTEQEMLRIFKDNSAVYLRFNVEHGLANIGWEEWERLGDVSAHTETYLMEVEVAKNMEHAVKVLCEANISAMNCRDRELSRSSTCAESSYSQ